MNIAALLANPLLHGFLKDQNLRDLVTRGEFRLSQEYLQRHLLEGRGDDLEELEVAFSDGHARFCGKFRKKPLPFAIPFSASFAVSRIVFQQGEKLVYLKVTESSPPGLQFLAEKLIGYVPFLGLHDGELAWDLMKTPKIGEMLDYRVGGVRVSDFVTLKEVAFRDGEVIGKVGIGA